MSQRRKFDKAFKLMTVELCRSGKSTTEVAAELGLGSEGIRKFPTTDLCRITTENTLTIE